MESIPSLSIQDVANIDAVLQHYIESAEADLVVVVDKGGNVMSQFGDDEILDITIIAALAAGSFAATKELARRIGEVEFNALYHQGNGSHIFMSSIDDDTIMITVFSSATTVGLVRHYSADAATRLAEILDAMRGKIAPVFSFSAEDIDSTNVFTEGK